MIDKLEQGLDTATAGTGYTCRNSNLLFDIMSLCTENTWGN